MATRKWGSELLVNGSTAGDQNQSAVTALADGGFMIAWRDDNPTDSVIRLQRYDALGNKVDGEITINDSVGDQSSPSIVQLSDGNIWVTQTDFDSDSDNDIEGQVINLSGTSLRYLQPNTTSGDDHVDADIASLGANGSVAAWTSNTTGDVLIRGFNVNGSDRFTERLANVVTVGTQDSPSIAANLDGSKFVVAWRHGNDDVISARVFDSSGVQVTGEISIPMASGVFWNSAGNPDVTFLDNDVFVVTWNVVDDTMQLGQEVRFAIYNGGGFSPGKLIYSGFLATSTTAGAQTDPQVVRLANGGFAIAWTSDAFAGQGIDDSQSSIKLQAYDGLGAKIGGEITVNTTTAGFQTDVSLATLNDGRVVVTWTDRSGPDDDIRAQIVDPRDGVVDGTSGADTLFGHDAIGDIMSGGKGADSLFGLNGDDSLYGGENNDQLYGGRGSDYLDGGASSDRARYDFEMTGAIVALDGSVVNAGSAAGDTLISIERLVGSNFADTLIGDGGANELFGKNGADVLNGKGGVDSLHGENGSDTYFADLAADVVEETNASLAVGGNDLVNFSGASGTFVLGDNVERLTLLGMAAIGGTGNGLANTLIGNTGANSLSGLAGIDLLFGGKGKDTLTGGTQADTFRFRAGDTNLPAVNFDKITDFAKTAAGDKFDYQNLAGADTNLFVGGSAAAATASQASINAVTGVASFAAGSGATLADALNDIAARINAGGSVAGEFAFFRVNNAGPMHLFISDAVAGAGANDVVVQLSNISTIGSLRLAGTDLMILT